MYKLRIVWKEFLFLLERKCMHITDLEKVLLRSKEQNAVSKRNTLALQNKLALSEQTFINNAALSIATSRNNVAL